MRVWHGEAEQDGFNGLIIAAGLDWREVTMLRAVARYLRQAGIPFSDRYMEHTLLAHPDVRGALVELFNARFDPRRRRAAARTRWRSEIEAAIDAVDSLDEDRILRGFLSVVQAMLRTNYFLPGPKPYVSFKLDPHADPADAAAAPAASRSSCTRRGSRACTCAAGRSRAAACAGRTGARTSAPRSSA